MIRHELVQRAWEGLERSKVWDCHTHLLGRGDLGTQAWVNPQMRSIWHPIQYLQRHFYLNASCLNSESTDLDGDYVRRLLSLREDFGQGPKLMLLAFDYAHDLDGRRRPDRSSFHLPDRYAALIASRYYRQFEWIASIHPYREDALDALRNAVSAGAKAVKWLPSAMGIDPASARCDAFYDELIRLDVPLLSHAGAEYAVSGTHVQRYGNPLRLRRPLDRGVRVIVAHCASLGSCVDMDRGDSLKEVDCFELFVRLMKDINYEKLVSGDISALTQVNRLGKPLETIIENDVWHHRILNGSDYPLPGVMPLTSLDAMVERGYISVSEATVLSDLRRHNALLFDFVCKRTIRYNEKRLPACIFETSDYFKGNMQGQII